MTLYGPLSLPIYGPILKGIRMIVSSVKNLSRKVDTSCLLLGPPRFIMNIAIFGFSIYYLDEQLSFNCKASL